MNRMTRVRYLSSYLKWISHQDFKNIVYYGFCRYFVSVSVFVIVFVIVFVFVFVPSYDFWIAFNISFQNMYGYKGLWSLRAEMMIIFEVMTDGHTYTHTHTHSPIQLIDSAHVVGGAEWKSRSCPNWGEESLTKSKRTATFFNETFPKTWQVVGAGLSIYRVILLTSPPAVQNKNKKNAIEPTRATIPRKERLVGLLAFVLFWYWKWSRGGQIKTTLYYYV